jgi:REP element-mobilizing transposase RayT
VFAKGQYYHLYNRGAGRQSLFIEESNYHYIQRRTKLYCRKFRLSVIAYCLLPNHYHFLIRQDGESLVSELPKRVFGGYSRAVNRKYGWSGTLFEGRFQSKLVDTDAYLLHLCRYIHANPVIHGIVDAPEDWPY